MTKTDRLCEFLTFYDLMSTRIEKRQDFSAYKFLPYSIYAFHVYTNRAHCTVYDKSKSRGHNAYNNSRNMVTLTHI